VAPVVTGSTERWEGQATGPVGSHFTWRTIVRNGERWRIRQELEILCTS